MTPQAGQQDRQGTLFWPPFRQGVRQAAGLTAERVNGLVADAGGLVGGHLPPRPLKQNLGHTRLQVLIGAVIGPLVALPGLVLVGTPWQLAQGWGWLAG